MHHLAHQLHSFRGTDGRSWDAKVLSHLERLQQSLQQGVHPGILCSCPIITFYFPFQLRQSGDFFDVTLACEDGQVPAHKLVLSAASDLFKQILKKNSHEHPLIFLYGIRIADVHSILEFIYNGETEVNFIRQLLLKHDCKTYSFHCEPQ